MERPTFFLSIQIRLIQVDTKLDRQTWTQNSNRCKIMRYRSGPPLPISISNEKKKLMKIIGKYVHIVCRTIRAGTKRF